jgi:hypothetical protein
MWTSLTNRRLLGLEEMKRSTELLEPIAAVGDLIVC